MQLRYSCCSCNYIIIIVTYSNCCSARSIDRSDLTTWWLHYLEFAKTIRTPKAKYCFMQTKYVRIRTKQDKARQTVHTLLNMTPHLDKQTRKHRILLSLQLRSLSLSLIASLRFIIFSPLNSCICTKTSVTFATADLQCILSCATIATNSYSDLVLIP